MIKWLYEWHDWGIYAIREVELLKSGISDKNYPGTIFSLVRYTKGGNPFKVEADHLFDTYEEATEYGQKNCPRGAF